MVNFGGHLDAFQRDEPQGGDTSPQLYVVPYNTIKCSIQQSIEETIHANDNEIPCAFQVQWLNARQHAADYFQQRLEHIWVGIFEALTTQSSLINVSENGNIINDDGRTNSNPHDLSFTSGDVSWLRGASTGHALELYVQTQSPESAHVLLTRLTRLYTVAFNNAEGLRKLVKKYDKILHKFEYHHTHPGKLKLLSPTLLPRLYASNFLLGLNMLEDSMTLMRTLLHVVEVQQGVDDDADSDSDNRPFLMPRRVDSEADHSHAVAKRLDEWDWLKRLVASLPDVVLPFLVAHRGFHSTRDRHDKRPLENSLSAYEMAWTSGIHLCECDVALTRDEKIVLAHDEDFARLALNRKDDKSSRRVSDLTFQELLALPLSNGVRPPLLLDVLRSARAISGNAQLIIEIKPGHPALATAVARLLLRHPDLLSRVAVLMSFDAVCMHRLRQELSTATAATTVIQSNPSLSPGGAGVSNFVVSTPILSAVSTRTSLAQLTEHSHLLPNSRPSSPSLENSFSALSYNPQFQHNRSHSRHLSQDHFGNDDNIGLDLSLPPSSPFRTMGLTSEKEKIEPALPPGTPISSAVGTTAFPFTFPKLMLLTVAHPPDNPCELQVQVSDLSPVDSWLQGDAGHLDGVYLQYEPAMHTAEGAAALRALAERTTIGVWGSSRQADPDDYDTIQWLVKEAHVSFVNTDLPITFRPDIRVQTSIK
jgi:glycerophosphoryl diester phosphodiesterase